MEQIRRALQARGLTPNKALGQNFLADEDTIARIVTAANIDGACVVEIGPGLGALTGPLAARAASVIAIEKDAKLAQALQQTLPCENLTVVTDDFLNVDLAALVCDAPWHAVGNLPYYVTTPIVEKLLTCGPASMTLMVQEEAAARFFALPGARVYGPVAVMSQTLYAPKRVCSVPPGCFYPAPEVDSAVVQLVRRESSIPDAAGFLSFLKRAFAMRRKTLRNNLAPKCGFDCALESLGLPPGVRAEAIMPETLATLYEMKRAGTLG